MNQNKMKITSFDAEETGCFGDVLSHAPEHRPLSVGMLGLGYFEYWRMYPALERQVSEDLDKAAGLLAGALPEYKVIYPGMVDTLDRAETAGSAFRDAQIDVLVVIAGTYLPDFITMHAINQIQTHPEVILFSTQTGNDVNPDDNYIATMRNSALIAMTQLSGSFRKMKLDYHTVVGEIGDPSAYRRITGLTAARSAAKRLKKSTYGDLLQIEIFREMAFEQQIDIISNSLRTMYPHFANTAAKHQNQQFDLFQFQKQTTVQRAVLILLFHAPEECHDFMIVILQMERQIFI